LLFILLSEEGEGGNREGGKIEMGDWDLGLGGERKDVDMGMGMGIRGEVIDLDEMRAKSGVRRSKQKQKSK